MTLVLLLLLPAACMREPAAPETHDRGSSVPGLEIAPAVRAVVRDRVEGFGQVAAEGEVPEVRDARVQLAEAEARQRLAIERLGRLQDLSRGAVVPRKELEAARAEEATAAALAARARHVLAAYGGDSPQAPLEAREIWVIAQVTQVDVGSVQAGAPAAFTPDAFRDLEVAGRVDAEPPYVDPRTQTAPVRIRVLDAERRLRPGMTGAVGIEVGEPRTAVVVPAAALVYDGGKPSVLVEESEGRYAPRAVRVGAPRDGTIEVLEGVREGERVVTTGAASVLSAARLPAEAEDH
jgi:hypothetical protein